MSAGLQTSTKSVSNRQSATGIAGHVAARCSRQCIKRVINRHPDKCRVSATHMTEHVADRCFRQCVKSVISRRAEKHKIVSNRQSATHVTELVAGKQLAK